MAVATNQRRALVDEGRTGTGYPRAAWIVAAVLALWAFAGQVVVARTGVLEPDDNGVLFTTVTYLLHGQIPITDFYEPYGIGLGIPGVVPHLLGADGAFALRLTYGVFPPLVTFLVTLFLWRRVDWKLAVLVGAVSLCSSVNRYSMGYAPLFAFALTIDWLAGRTATGSLAEIAARSPQRLLMASAVLSLAAWARMEYAAFGVVWAIALVLVLRGRRRWWLAAGTVGLSALPTIVVLVTGGATHLWWILRYLVSPSLGSFSGQRGRPVEWHLFVDRLSQLAHFRFGASSNPGWVLSTYGVGAGVVAGAVWMLLDRRRRARLLFGDPTFVVPFMLVICALVLYAQISSFSGVYGELAAPVLWTAAALLIKRLSVPLLAVVTVVLAYPLVANLAPGVLADMWKSRPSTTDRPAVPRMNHIPIEGVGGADLASLAGVWRKLRLQGRPTVSVELRNDTAWGGDAVVGFVLDASAAAWPMTYDPGLVNRSYVERETVHDLCRNRAPVVQLDHDYPYPPDKKVFIGSRILDQFLAVDYRVRAIGGTYRVLLPATSRCVLPRNLGDAAVTRLRDYWFGLGQNAEAGALAILLMERNRAAGQPVSPVDASLAALGGYKLEPGELPPGPLGLALRALDGDLKGARLAALATVRWPSDIETLAVQTAWLSNRQQNEAAGPTAALAVLALADRHPSWQTAITNATAVIPPSDLVITRLARAGAASVPQFDEWRRDYYTAQHRWQEAIAASLALIAAYNRVDDPLNAGQAELRLAGMPGVTPACARLLTERASSKPGIAVAAPQLGPRCTDPKFASASL